ncbi:MAG: PAS domain S-box protein [Pseudomonadota bacterium]
MTFLNSLSINKKLTLLIIFAVLPCLAIILYSGIELRIHLIKDAQSNVLLITHNMALAQKGITQSTKQTLSTLSKLPSIQSMDSNASSIIFKSVLEQNDSFINISLVDLKGEVLASSQPFTGVNLADRKHVKEALKKNEFAIGEYIVTRIGKAIPAFTFAYPVLDKEGMPKAVLTTAIKLDIFPQFYDVEALPEKSFVAVTDYKGTRLFYYPAQENTNPIGKPIRAETWSIATKGKAHGFLSAAGSDGLHRIVAYEKVSLNQESPPYLCVWAGIPEGYILKDANASLVRNLLLMLLGAMISVFISWVIGKNTLISPIQRLVSLTQKLAMGNLEARTELSANAGEIGTLTLAFHNMAESLTMNRKALQEKEQRFRSIIEDVSEISIQGYNENREVIFWNHASEKLFGYTKKEAMGRKLEDLILPHSMREGVKTLHHRWIKFGEKIPAGEFDLIDKHGAVVPVYSSYVLTETNLEKEMFCIDVDMGPIKQAEEALRKSEDLFKLITQHTSALVSIHDSVGNYIFASPSHERLGYKPEDLMGKSGTSMIVEEDLGPLRKQLEKFQKRNLSRAFLNYRIKDKKGKIHYYRGSFDAVFKTDGSMERIICVGEDITELRKAQSEKEKAYSLAAESEKLALVGQVAGKMAHDFNNILGVVMGNAELAMLDCQDEQTKKKLELIYNQTIRGKNMTKDLVAFAKDQEPKQEFFKIDEKMDLVITLLKKDIEGIAVTREYSHDVPEILADPGMIEHAILNLVQNSIHATSLVEQPQIILRTYQQDGQIFIEIEDNGCGIPLECLGEIFKPSFTLKGSKDKKGMYKPGIKGTGYGMSNVKKYVQQHKGVISIHSELKKGTKITISLPIIKKELSIKEIEEIKKEKICSEKYILLVEDEQAILDVQYRILTHEPCNHKVDIADHGKAAINLLSRNEYDLISLDYVLPGGFNGMDVYHHVRETNKSIPILFISGNIEFLESIKELKQKDPYIDHLSKPCMNIDYLNCINKLLGQLS